MWLEICIQWTSSTVARETAKTIWYRITSGASRWESGLIKGVVALSFENDPTKDSDITIPLPIFLTGCAQEGLSGSSGGRIIQRANKPVGKL